ncbi:MAG: alpha/beta hydrolase [Cyanothece sp. SIO1E1]|nr:alpha/beta hydrolase [Cyanothece sp. SIO1E1]
MNDYWWQTTFPQGRQTLRIASANGAPSQIAYGEVGHGQPLILVHGVGVWSYCWRYNIEPLSQHYRVICFDAKGYGFSEKPNHGEQSGHQILELERIIRGLCDQPAIVVAESLGALTALAVAENCPDLIDRLVVINVPIFPKRLPSWGMRALANFPIALIQAVDRLRLARLFAPLVRQLTRRGRCEVVIDPTQITAEEVYWAAYPYIECPNAITKFAEDLKLSLDELERLAQGQPNLITQIQAGLGAIATPTLILWSDQDAWFPVADGEALQRYLPNSKLQILPNCGHQAAAGCPDIVNQAILAFVLPA